MTNKKTSTKKTWEDLTPEEKKTGTIAAILVGLIILIFIIGIAVSVNNSSKDSKVTNNAGGTQTTEKNPKQDVANDTAKKLNVMNIADEAIASADGGNCYVEYIEPDESVFASVSSMGSAATYYFVESAKQVFASGECNSKYTFAYSMNGESSRGSTQKFTLGVFAATPDQYAAFDWSGLSGTSVGELFRKNNMLNIPTNVLSKIEYGDFVYSH